MTATAHALIGGAIAASISNPAIGLPLAALSHPIADMVPHWDLGLGWRNKNKVTFFVESFIDLTIGVVLSYLLFGSFTSLPYLLGAIFFSLVLDFLLVPYWFLNWKFPPFSTAYKFQHTINKKAKLPWGILTQITTVVLLVIVLNYITH